MGLPTIVLAQSEPLEFLSGFMAACLAGCPVFLANPNWDTTTWTQVLALAQPDLLWTARADISLRSSTQSAAQPGWILIPTGGTSGVPRFAIHTWATLQASVLGFQQHFGLTCVNACCVLPLYHVSGLMQFLRALITGGTLAIAPFAALSQDPESTSDLAGLLNINSHVPQTFCLSLVPTQLHRLLQYPDRLSWLARFQMILLGGAPAWRSLLDSARLYQLRLAPTYGMTETASQVATLHPEDFLQGHTSSGQVLPHAQITLQEVSSHSGRSIGCLAIRAKSLCLGYYPGGFPPDKPFLTDDIGYFDVRNELQVVGRRSRKIISGGENIYPEAIEAALLATELVVDAIVVGMPDPEWGEVVTAVYVPRSSTVMAVQLRNALQEQVSRYQIPKYWIAVERLPRGSQGKINLQQLKDLIYRHRASSINKG